MTIKELQDRSYIQAVAKGWAGDGAPEVTVPTACALIHSEVSEALESYRKSEPVSWTDQNGKPEGMGPEFADVLIRIGHYAEIFGIDLEHEVDRKLQYNDTRAHRHGGKKC